MGEVASHRPPGEFTLTPIPAVLLFTVADEVDAPFGVLQIDTDFDQVAVLDFADRSACERLGADMADTGAGRNTRKAGVGDQCDFPAEG